MESTSLPSAEQLLAARSRQWHQDGHALLSFEALREWVNRSGLVLYAPRAQQLGAPAPSLIEATLGKAEPAPTVAESETARSLLARLIAEGAAVPLNLFGTPGGMGTDVPDFVVSAAVFSYIFTLRGNKAWKQAPATTGAVKVSPLALAAYEMLAAKVTLSAYDLTTQLGKEVTEAAVLRALTELWSQLRVIPVPQADGEARLWELASARFTKQIKSGANAGQPSALSALISLYLGQAISATEDEIEYFLSPLSPRSRTRDVLHALLSARQLETIVVDGKTLLHVRGELPAFAATAQPAHETEPEIEGAPRIAKFTPRPGSKLGTGLRTKPAFGGKSAFGKPGGERERRPFHKEGPPGFDARPAGTSKPAFSKPVFDKPWQDDRPTMPAEAAAAQEEADKRPSFAPRTFARKPGDRKPGADRRPGGARPSFGSRPSFGGAGRYSSGAQGRPPRRDVAPQPPRDFAPQPRTVGQTDDGAGADPGSALGPASGQAPRKTFSKPGTFGRKREGFAGKPSFGGGEGRPSGRSFSAASSGDARRTSRDAGGRAERPAGGGFKRPGSYAPRPGGGFGAKPAFAANPSALRSGSGNAGAEGTPPRKVFRKFDAPRDGKPFGPKPFGSKPFAARPAGRGAFGGDRAAGAERPARPAGDRPARPSSARTSSARPFSDRPARPFSAPSASRDRPAPGDRARPDRRADSRPSSGGRPLGGAAGKAASFARGGSPFAKFADGKKPFRKPGPGKPGTGNSGTGKPGVGKSSGPKRAGGGFAPVKRQRPGRSST